MCLFLFVFKNGSQLAAPIKIEDIEKLRKSVAQGTFFGSETGTCINCGDLVGCGAVIELEDDPETSQIPEA